MAMVARPSTAGARPSTVPAARPSTAAASGARGGPSLTQDDTQLLKEKLRLLEADRKSFFESTDEKQKANRDEIRRLRRENKDLKATIMAARKGTGTVLGKEARQLDDGIYKLTLRLDELRERVAERKADLHKEREKAKDIDVECEPLLTETHPLSRKIRMLENRLDKSLIKYNEAMAIKKTYEQIVHRLKEESVGFDNQLAAIERTLKAKEHDYQELIQMSHEANHKKEVAKKELQDFKLQFDRTRIQKDKELTERKAYVQSKVDQTQKLEKKEKELKMRKEKSDSSSKGDDEQGLSKRNTLMARSGMGMSAEDEAASEAEQERLKQYEEAFKAIREATGVSDVQEVLHKFVSQEETHRNLVQMVQEAQTRIDQLNTERAELTAKLEELRYSGSGQLGSRRIVEEFELHLAEAHNQTQVNAERYEQLAKLLINVKGGIEHLVSKLSSIRSEGIAPPVSDDTLVEVLKHCEQRLVNLASEVVPSEEPDDALVSTAIELSAYNRRVRLPREDEEEGGDDDGLEPQEEADDDAVLKREQVKRISESSIQRETKKARKKRRDK